MKSVLFSVGLYFCFITLSVASANPPAYSVASAHPLATQAGMEILRKGGNAFDAAVAVSAVLGVVEPYSSGFGGGGFWLLYQADRQQAVMIDGREKAPLAATETMYLDDNGEVIPRASVDGALAAGIPGHPAALVHIAERYGSLPLAVTLAKAIEIARTGFPADARFRDYVTRNLARLQQAPGTAKVFLHNGETPQLDHRIKQPVLANTLTLLAQHGKAGFYAGIVAEKLVQGVRQNGGIWRMADLAAYQVVERQPLIGQFHGKTIITAAPPSGGVVLLTTLNQIKQWSWADTHLIVEAMRRAYRDRALYLGDPDFVDIPLQRLLSDAYALALTRNTDQQRATPSTQLRDVAQETGEGQDTTHFSILDQHGNAVSATLSINTGFGSAFIPTDTGVLLNNEMDDFSIRPGVPNSYGLVGGAANAIAPGKRMLSSMTPTIVLSQRDMVVLGTPGGSRIISMVLLAILAHDNGEQPQAWVAAPRYHHQYLPDEIQAEPDAFTPEQLQALTARGHKVHVLQQRYGNMHAILWDKKARKVTAASDPRGNGSAMVQQIDEKMRHKSAIGRETGEQK